ncbi:unnamed protein product [Eruca vesicaria subsp. sativa]|uniref:F-box domain-containing protein n=1 Tax=Eruca vesicaria subsp. sativa TaxID=29727 RepID=A0ABC8LV61_ERUVS|nr:unnamed protein product [Eruca vesicaria subsp. sativa]
MERTDISELPEDILKEIMVRVPLESLVDQCICVCKKWRSTIRGEEFKKLYWAQSITRPRLLFDYIRTFAQHSDYLLQSVYQQEEPLLSSALKKMIISSAREYKMFCAPQRGLVCLGYETKFVLCNPATNKFKALPECKRLRPERESKIICFFGYDEVTKVFTFLISETDYRCTRKFSHNYKPLMRQQVFTVELAELNENIKEKPWRVIKCEHNHVPVTKSLCLKGVLYYGAKSLVEMDKSMIISFDMRSEVFTIIDMPKGVKLADFDDRLVNYNGEVCLVKDSGDVNHVMEDGTRVYEIYVKDENAIRKWREEPVVIPCLGDAVRNVRFCCAGTINGATGELILVFATELGAPWKETTPFVLYYDTATRKVRLFKVEGGVDEDLYSSGRTFVNHCDSLLLS